MGNGNSEMIEALQMKIEALQTKVEAYQIKIEALEYRLQHQGGSNGSSARTSSAPTSGMQSTSSYTESAPSREQKNTSSTEGGGERRGKKRGRKPKLQATDIQNLQEPVYNEVVNILGGQGFNKATYKAITGVLLCIYENKTANLSTLQNYVGGTKVTIVRHTTLLKKLGLLRYEGSRKKGYYMLTDKGKALLSSLRGV